MFPRTHLGRIHFFDFSEDFIIGNGDLPRTHLGRTDHFCAKKTLLFSDWNELRGSEDSNSCIWDANKIIMLLKSRLCVAVRSAVIFLESYSKCKFLSSLSLSLSHSIASCAGVATKRFRKRYRNSICNAPSL